MKASTADISFFKGIILVQIHDKLISDGTLMSIDELDDFLKAYSDLDGISCSDMDHKQMQQLKEWSKHFATSIGLEIDNDKRLDLNFKR